MMRPAFSAARRGLPRNVTIMLPLGIINPKRDGDESEAAVSKERPVACPRPPRRQGGKAWACAVLQARQMPQAHATLYSQQTTLCLYVFSPALHSLQWVFVALK